MTKTIRLLLVLFSAAFFTLTSCQSPKRVNYSAYEKIPLSGTSAILRPILKACPYTAKRAFYGNWGGSGDVGGKPIDAMDDLFRRHDILYTVLESNRSYLLADKGLVTSLQELDDRKMTPQAVEFRKRTVGFFSGSLSHFMGKPMGGFFKKKERPENPFSDPDAILAFYDPGHPGFPDDFAKRRAKLNRKPPCALPKVGMLFQGWMDLSR